jgi:hypothetical protein
MPDCVLSVPSGHSSQDVPPLSAFEDEPAGHSRQDVAPGEFVYVPM